MSIDNKSILPQAADSLPKDSGSNAKATFILRIHFHRNATWQGTVTWLDTGKVQNFRSTLELILLMDGALSEQASLGLESLDLENLPPQERSPEFTDSI